MITLVQCDFDGTITEKDVGFLLLDAFARGDWRQLLAEHREGKISVGSFNTRAFAMVKADRQTLVNFMQGKVQIRAGFKELLECCRKKNFQFAIVSNGLDFYIDAILRDIGVGGIEVFAAKTKFSHKGIEAKYIGPDGNLLWNAFKEAYAKSFLKRGYRVIYVGNGFSDIPPARLAHQIFARDELLTYCRQMNVGCIPFNDFNDVVKGLELLG